jgi:hypothetical protein
MNMPRLNALGLVERGRLFSGLGEPGRGISGKSGVDSTLRHGVEFRKAVRIKSADLG